MFRGRKQVMRFQASLDKYTPLLSHLILQIITDLICRRAPGPCQIWSKALTVFRHHRAGQHRHGDEVREFVNYASLGNEAKSSS